MMRVGDNFCPGILHAVPAKDGLLLRIRVPGGLIQPSQLSSIAELSTALSDGQIEITSRANIQLRAIKPQDLAQVVASLTLAGLLPSREHDRVRNIIASPFAGLDNEELLDTQPFVRQLDHRLTADSMFAELHPKFSMAFDGGGRWFSRETDDIALRAVAADGRLYFHLSIGGVTSGLSVTTDRAVDCMLETAKSCLNIARQLDIPVRGRRIIAVPGTISRVMESLSEFLVPCPPPNNFGLVAEATLGILQTKKTEFISFVPSVPLGRLQATQAQVISALTKDCDASLRLAPWRGIVIGDLPQTMASHALKQIHNAGLSLDGKDGFHGLSACAGSNGCDASLADVRADAVSLARKLAGLNTNPGWTVNISGCEKQCAMRNGATAELVATELGYSMKLHGITVASHCSPSSAIEAIVACHAGFATEVYS
jgi:precorrin-3B synthase